MENKNDVFQYDLFNADPKNLSHSELLENFWATSNLFNSFFVQWKITQKENNYLGLTDDELYEKIIKYQKRYDEVSKELIFRYIHWRGILRKSNQDISSEFELIKDIPIEELSRIIKY